MYVVDVVQTQTFADASLRLSGHQLHVRLCMPMTLSSRKEKVAASYGVERRNPRKEGSDVDEVNDEHGSNMFREYSSTKSVEIVNLYEATRRDVYGTYIPLAVCEPQRYELGHEIFVDAQLSVGLSAGK